MDQRRFEHMTPEQLSVATAVRLEETNIRLYGNGHDDGDIPAMRKDIAKILEYQRSSSRKVYAFSAIISGTIAGLVSGFKNWIT